MDAKDESANDPSPGMTRSDNDSSWDDSRTGDMRWPGMAAGGIDGSGRERCSLSTETSVLRSGEIIPMRMSTTDLGKDEVRVISLTNL